MKPFRHYRSSRIFRASLLVGTASISLAVAPGKATAQSTIYGLNSPSAGVVDFGNVNATTGAFTPVSHMPSGTTLSIGVQPDNPILGEYYFASGGSNALAVLQSGSNRTLNVNSALLGFDTDQNTLLGMKTDAAGNHLTLTNAATGTQTVLTTSFAPTMQSFVSGAGAVNTVGREVYILGNSGTTLFTVSADTGALIRSVSLSRGTAGNLAWNGATGTLYDVAVVGAGDIRLVSINSVTGAVTVISSSNVASGLANNERAISVNGNSLYLFTGSSYSVIDLTTGQLKNTLSSTASELFSQSGIVIGGATTFSYNVTNAGETVYKTGSGTTVLSGQNLYTGGTNILAGTLSISSDNNLGTGGVVAMRNGTGLTLTQSGSYKHSITLSGSDTITVSSGQTAVLTGAISGSGTLIQAGSGTLILTGANSYVGGTTIAAGTLSIGNGGTSGSIAGDITDNGTLTFNRADQFTFGNKISGTGTLTKAGTGTLTLTNNNTYTGGTLISAGILQIGNGPSSGSITGDVIDNSVLNFNYANGTKFGGVISGTGALTLNGSAAPFRSSGWLTLTGNSTYSGGTTVSEGRIVLGTGGTSGSIVGNVNLNPLSEIEFDRSDVFTFTGTVSGGGTGWQTGTGITILTGANNFGTFMVEAGTLQIGNGGTSGSIAGNITDSSTLTFNRSDALTYAGVVSGTGSLTKAGAGTLTLSSANSYSGGTSITGGLVNFTTLRNFGSGIITLSGGGVQWASGSTVDISGRLAALGSGGGTFDTNGNLITLASAIGGTGGLTKAGTGTLTLTGVNTYSGGTVISVGTLQVGAGGTIGSIMGGVVDNDTLVINRSDSISFAGVISGAGAVQQLGTGTLTLTAASTYTGVTTVSAGALLVNGSIAASSGVVVASGSTLGGTGTVAATTVAGVGILAPGNGAGAIGTLNIAGNLSLGSAAITNLDIAQTAADEVSVTGTAAIAGTLNISFASGSFAVPLQYTLLNSAGSLSGAFSTYNAVGLSTNYSSAVSYDAHDVFLTVYTVLSPTTIANINIGTETISGSQTIGGLASSGSGGTLDISGGALTDNQNVGTTFSGNIIGSGSFTKTGTGTLILDGSNTYTGGTAINGGSLVIGDAAHPGASIVGPVTVGAGGTLQGHGTVNGTVTVAAGGVLQPGGTIGTLNVSSATIAAGSTYAVETDAAGQADLLNATGSVGISSGATLAVNEDAPFSSYGRTTTYTVLQAGGGITGTFGTVTSASAGFLPSVNYGANSISLTLMRPDLTAALASGTNQTAVATALFAGGASALTTPLAGMSDGGVRAVYGQLTGDIHTSLRSAAVEDSRVIRNAVLARLDAPTSTTGVWAAGFGGYGSIGTDGNASGLHHDSAGFIAGADMEVGDGFRLGMGGAYTSNNASTNGHTSTARGDNGHVLAYAGWSGSTIDLRLGGDLGWGSTRVKRTLAAYSEIDSSSQDQSIRQVFGEIGYRARWMPIEPYFSLASISATTGAFNETGGIGALSGAAKTDTQTYSTLGLRLTTPIHGEDWLQLRVNVGWQHSFGNFLPAQTQSLQSLSQSFVITGAPLARDAVAMQMGFAAAIAPDASLLFDYDGSAAAGVQNNAVRGGLEWRF